MAKKKFIVQRLEDDPIALRASIGGDTEMGFYISYRGDPAKVLAMVEEVARKFKEHLMQFPQQLPQQSRQPRQN